MTRRARKSARSSSSGGVPFSSERELIVVARPEAGLRARGTTVTSAAGVKVANLQKILSAAHARMLPLFGPSEERVLRATSGSAAPSAKAMWLFYRVLAADERLERLAAKLLEQPQIQAAYVKAPAEPAVRGEEAEPLPMDPPPTTPDFTPRQLYLEAAPGGIDARFAWTRPGGAGTGVRLISIEGDWRLTHEDLGQHQGGLVGGQLANDVRWRNHGTAVLGELGGDGNTFGVTGICPEVHTRVISIFGLGSAQAIQDAADLLSPGDIVLVELHRAGPRFDFEARQDQRGYIPIEWWPDDFAAMQYATGLGILVVAVGGNGAEDLDDELYDTPAPGFPPSWANPFRRVQDSGSILVGAGAPPPGTHGHSHGPDRSRLAFSNYGSCIDAQGWGTEVTTCGYGHLQGGPDEDLWYLDGFAGTSSAAPCIAGAIGAMQGGLRSADLALLTPATARELLRTTGTLQRDAPGRPKTQRIGNRPDLRQAFHQLGISGKVVVDKDGAVSTARAGQLTPVKRRGKAPARGSRAKKKVRTRS